MLFFFYNDSVKLFYYLILCFIEGHKFISFILTVTCLPSLNEGFTLPYLNLRCSREWIDSLGSSSYNGPYVKASFETLVKVY